LAGPSSVESKRSLDVRAIGGRIERGHPFTPFADLAVVIAAFNEERSIGAVLDQVPARVLGLSTASLVVVDGATDGTADVARSRGATVVELPVRSGQGVALRLGYELACELGATYIATLDADGQYNPSDLTAVVKPLVDGHADFVSGSRILSGCVSKNWLRRAGTHFFALIMSRMVGQRVTDTSNGLRAMSTDVIPRVTLTQAQYQSAELLIDVFSAGFRVLEVPVSMGPRTSGRTKKGVAFVYGFRYAWALLATWHRERSRLQFIRRAHTHAARVGPREPAGGASELVA
jgi:glycosyltransferase involved in cell wall biosynthesis